MARIAKALIEPTDKGKVPFVYVVIVYVIPAGLFIMTKVWQLFILAVAFHLFLRFMYKKDQHYLTYTFMELKTPDRFEP